MDLLATTSLLGGLAALASGAAWAVGSILFRRIGDHAPPLGMNLGKGLVGLVYLGVALLFTGVEPVSAQAGFYLALSGIVGIAIGDTLFFATLVRLEPRLTLLLSTVGQAVTVLMAFVFLGERPTGVAWGGMGLIVGGVTWVMWEQMGPEERTEVRQKRLFGIVLGLLATVSMSAGYLLSKMALTDISALQATFLRLLAGVAGLLVVGLATRQLKPWLGPFRSPALLRSILVAVAVVMFGAFYLSMVALKFTDASVASVLASTEPLFILPLAALVLGDKVSLRSMVGSGIAVVGVAMVLLALT